MMRNSTKIVNMGYMEKGACLTLFLLNVVDWKTEDPKGKSIEMRREIRDQIKQRVMELVAALKTPK